MYASMLINRREYGNLVQITKASFLIQNILMLQLQLPFSLNTISTNNMLISNGLFNVQRSNDKNPDPKFHHSFQFLNRKPDSCRGYSIASQLQHALISLTNKKLTINN